MLTNPEIRAMCSTTMGALLTLAYFLHCEGAASASALNDRPIIGVLAQEQHYKFWDKYPEDYTSYIAASYVKALEASGARVVPIMIGKDRSYYEDIMGKLNGVLFPGGATYFNQSNGFADAGQHIYDLAIEMNEAGDYFPVFGTCLGFELIIILASGRGPVENRVTCHSFGNNPLNFTRDFRSSKMYKSADDDIINILSREDITVNHHQFCIVDENLKSHNLTKDWRVTAHSDDANGLKFIASLEHNKYPFYGVQFHPEKIFEWKQTKTYSHSFNAIKANRHFMDFFVNECRKNHHSFADAEEENKCLIYNYNTHFTGAEGSAYEQCYFFEPRNVGKNKVNYTIVAI